MMDFLPAGDLERDHFIIALNTFNLKYFGSKKQLNFADLDGAHALPLFDRSAVGKGITKNSYHFYMSDEMYEWMQENIVIWKLDIMAQSEFTPFFMACIIFISQEHLALFKLRWLLHHVSLLLCLTIQSLKSRIEHSAMPFKSNSV
jgi:hypothetical protein